MRKYWYFLGKDRETVQRIFGHTKEKKHSAPPKKGKKAGKRVLGIEQKETEKKADTGKIEHLTGTVEPVPKTGRARKQDYFISVFDKKIGQTVKKISGNVLLIDGIAFGLNKPHPKSFYTITDLITGFAVGECRTQKDIFTALTPELMQMIKEKHTTKDIQVYIDRIKDAYMGSEF